MCTMKKSYMCNYGDFLKKIPNRSRLAEKKKLYAGGRLFSNNIDDALGLKH